MYLLTWYLASAQARPRQQRCWLASGPRAESLPEPALLSMETQANSISVEVIRNGNGLTPFLEAGKKLQHSSQDTAVHAPELLSWTKIIFISGESSITADLHNSSTKHLSCLHWKRAVLFQRLTGRINQAIQLRCPAHTLVSSKDSKMNMNLGSKNRSMRQINACTQTFI